MAGLDAFSSSSPSSSAEKSTSSAAKASLSGPSDDAFDDACSICLEPFSSDDPATITSCKHEYHLHCILEWSQRSKECPICWQLFVLKDPASQELLSAVESERCLRSRNISSPLSMNVRFHEDNIEHEASYSDDSDFDFDERIIRHHLAATANRDRCFLRTVGRRSTGLVFSSPAAEMSERTYLDSPVFHDIIYESSDDSDSPFSVSPYAVQAQQLSSGTCPNVNLVSSTGIDNQNEIFSKPRVVHSQVPSDNSSKKGPSEIFSFPVSIKSKLSATSARCKESISRSTKGIKEKLFSRNNFVKELSKGVQHEMSKGFAGFTRMFERIDLTPAKSSEGTSSFSKGKSVQENVIAPQPLVRKDGDNALCLSSDATTRHVSATVPRLVGEVSSD